MFARLVSGDNGFVGSLPSMILRQAQAKPHVTDTPGVQPARVITLVHGTWAKNAPWTHPESPLCKALNDQLGSAHIWTFLWSGRNSHNARVSAALDLRAHLHSLKLKFPRSRHYLIAHSHGGNVCLYALREKALRDGISGVVCLSTPFLVAPPRDGRRPHEA